jgi:ankyrin repeat protein
MGYVMTESEMDTIQRLLEAIKYNDVKQIAIEVINNGADVNYNKMYDMYFGTPLHYACKQKCKRKTIRFLLLAGADINAQDYYGDTPLHESVKDEDYDRVRWLLNLNADIYKLNNCKETPFGLSKKNQLLYDIVFPYSNGHKRWKKIKPIILAISKLNQCYYRSVDRVWKPGGVGYLQCEKRFESLQ